MGDRDTFDYIIDVLIRDCSLATCFFRDDGSIYVANESYYQLFNISNIDNHIDKYNIFKDVQLQEQLNSVKKKCDKINSYKFKLEYKISYSDNNKEILYLGVSVAPFYYKNQKYFLLKYWDFTKEEKLKKEEEKMRNILYEKEKELEQFIYIASHDLQEPLRIIVSYCNLLEENYKDKFDKKGNRYLKYIVNAGFRMKELISELLDFSRINKNIQKAELIDLNEVVNDMKRYFEPSIVENNVIIKCNKLPSITVEKIHIRQIFNNLTSNAIKYRKKDGPLLINISVQDIKDYWVFSFSDNGIGISEKHYQRIFELFKRLYTREEYPGTGIGLALCKKIIQSYGGEIWVKSKINKGSTFYFSFPKNIL